MSDTCWDILGIDATANEKAIKKAYALKLKLNKPDKNPAGFRRLREAYEQALEERFWYSEDDDCPEIYNEECNKNYNEECDDGFEKVEASASVVETSVNDHHSASSAIADNSLLNYTPIDDDLEREFEQTLIENLTLIIKHDSDYFQPTEQFNDDSIPIVQHAQQQLIEWHKQWQQSINIVDDNCANSTPFDSAQSNDAQLNDAQLKSNPQPLPLKATANTNQPDEPPDRNNKETADARLSHCLTEQFDQLKQLPLDALDEYQRALIVFFDDHLKAYPTAYTLAKSHFDWQQYLDSWQTPEYPWYLIQDIEEGYCAYSHFATKHQLQKYMAKSYSVLYQHWDFSLPYAQAPSRWQFFRQLWIPTVALELSQQLNGLQAEMLSVSDAGVIDNKDINYPQLLILKKRLRPFGMIKWSDFVFIALGVGAVIVPLALLFPYPSARYDYIGVVTVLSLAYLYWQLQISYLINPEYNWLSQTVRIGWGIISLCLWILFANYLPVTNHGVFSLLSIDNYYGAHLAGCSALLAITSFMRPAHLKHIIWVTALCLLLFTTVLPWAVEVTNGLGFMTPKQGDISPLVWLAPMLPVLLTTLGSYVYPLRGLIVIGKNMLTLFGLASALLAFTLLIIGSDLFTSNYLLLTLLTSVFILVIIFMLMFITTHDSNEPDML